MEWESQPLEVGDIVTWADNAPTEMVSHGLPCIPANPTMKVTAIIAINPIVVHVANLTTGKLVDRSGIHERSTGLRWHSRFFRKNEFLTQVHKALEKTHAQNQTTRP